MICIGSVSSNNFLVYLHAREEVRSDHGQSIKTDVERPVKDSFELMDFISELSTCDQLTQGGCGFWDRTEPEGAAPDVQTPHPVPAKKKNNCF